MHVVGRIAHNTSNTKCIKIMFVFVFYKFVKTSCSRVAIERGRNAL